MAIYGLGNIRDERLHRAFQVPPCAACFCAWPVLYVRQAKKVRFEAGGRSLSLHCISTFELSRSAPQKWCSVLPRMFHAPDSRGHREVVPRDDPAPEQVMEALGAREGPDSTRQLDRANVCLWFFILFEAQGKQRCGSQQGVGASKLLALSDGRPLWGSFKSGASTRRCSLPSWIWQGVPDQMSGSLSSRASA